MTAGGRLCRLGREEGTALVIAITLVLVISAVAAAVAIASRTETMIAANFRQGREALYAAEGVAGVAIHDLAATPDWSAVLSGAATSSFTDGAAIGPRTTPGGATIDICCGPGSLTGTVQQRAHGGRTWGTDTPQWQVYAWGAASSWLPVSRSRSPFYVVAWVADDPADGDANPAADANGIVEIHAQALGPTGARRIVQVLVQRQLTGAPPASGPGVRVLSWREIRW